MQVSKADSIKKSSVPMDATIKDIEHIGNHLYFYIKADISSTGTGAAATNVFQQMMEARAALKYPDSQCAGNPKPTHKHRLHDKIVELLRGIGAGWSENTLASGCKFCQLTCDLIWMVRN